MNIVSIKEVKCTACGHSYQIAGDPTGIRKPPKPGQPSLCLNCGELMVFDENLQMSPITPERAAQMKENHPDIYQAILAVQDDIQERNENRKN